MTTDQWVALIGQVGIGGLALLGIAYLFIKVVVPMASARAGEIVQALRDLTAEVHQLRQDVAAVADRISRIEGIFDHDNGGRRRGDGRQT